MSDTQPPIQDSNRPGPPPEEIPAGDALVLRRMHSSFAAELFAAAKEALPELCTWMTWAHPSYSEAETQQFLDHSVSHSWPAREAFDFAIILEGKIVGSCSLLKPPGAGEHDDGRTMEIGYWVARSARGRGVASRATAALTRAAFDMGLECVQIAHNESNRSSEAVPRRLGFKRVGSQPAMGKEPLPEGRSAVDIIWQLQHTEVQSLTM